MAKVTPETKRDSFGKLFCPNIEFLTLWRFLSSIQLNLMGLKKFSLIKLENNVLRRCFLVEIFQLLGDWNFSFQLWNSKNRFKWCWLFLDNPFSARKIRNVSKVNLSSKLGFKLNLIWIAENQLDFSSLESFGDWASLQVEAFAENSKFQVEKMMSKVSLFERNLGEFFIDILEWFYWATWVASIQVAL